MTDQPEIVVARWPVRSAATLDGLAELLAAYHLQTEAEKGSVRLSVWRWRTDAIAVYERIGFTVVDSWDAREQLVCMEHAV